MALIEWKPVYETGIVALDKEHQQLVAQISRLGEAILEKRGEEVLAEILAALEEYTESHFQHEEELMQQFGFSGLDEHRQIHQQLRDAVQELKSRSTPGTDGLVKELYKLLRNWLLEHIVEVDNKYGAFLESRGGRFIS